MTTAIFHPTNIILLSIIVTASVEVSSFEFHIAPMQCYTNQPLRKLYNNLSPSSIKWTEMEKVDDLLLMPSIEQSLRKRLGSEELDIILQLGSNDPEKLYACSKIASQQFPNNLREINLNCGCPAIDSGGAVTYGASLMKNSHLTGKLVEAIASATSLSDNHDIAVSVKTRLAVFDSLNDLRPLNEKDYRLLTNYISTIYDSGANHVILHSRPAILSGLSPVKNRIAPELDYDFVNQIASEFKDKVKITMNGGITSLFQLNDLQSRYSDHISSYMAGRWCLRRPLDLVGVETAISKGDDNDINLHKAISSYIDYTRNHQYQFSMSDLCLPLFLVTEQLRDYYNQENESGILSWKDMEVLHDNIQNGLVQLSMGKVKDGGSSINFKRLSNSFKSLVGTKVVNKWKRNRAEL